MELSGLSNGCGSWDCEFGISRPFAWNSLARRLGSVVLAVSLGGVTVAQSAPIENDFMSPTTEEIRNARPLVAVLPEDIVSWATLIATAVCAAAEGDPLGS